MLRYLSAFWGAVGVTTILGCAIYRVLSMLLSSIDIEIVMRHWLALVVCIVFMAYTEGYRGFQKKFSPRVAARVLYLSKEAGWINGIFAPLFCMGYFGTTLRRQISSIAVSSTIVIVVILVRQMPQPWRSILDAGVIIGLLWGVVSFLVYIWIAFNRTHFPHSPELPAHYEYGQD